jgi:hypothetical protein
MIISLRKNKIRTLFHLQKVFNYVFTFLLWYINTDHIISILVEIIVAKYFWKTKKWKVFNCVFTFLLWYINTDHIISILVEIIVETKNEKCSIVFLRFYFDTSIQIHMCNFPYRRDLNLNFWLSEWHFRRISLSFISHIYTSSEV